MECNLYGYVRNRPLDLVDPTGTEGRKVVHNNVGEVMSAAAPVAIAVGLGGGGPKVLAGVRTVIAAGKSVLKLPLVAATRTDYSAVGKVLFIAKCYTGTNPLFSVPPCAHAMRVL